MDAIAPAAALGLDREPLPREAWFVACAASELTADAPLARRIHDRPIVLFRGADGAAVALYDRCPHRGVALSLGKMVEGAVACGYHGWRFGPGGACTHIPSLCEDRAVAGGVAAEAYPCTEQDGYVWVWTGEGAPSPAAPLAIPGFAERAWVQAAVDLACEAMLPIENNLDVSHPYFAHPRTHPQWYVIEQIGFRENVYRLALTETGLRLTGGRDGYGGVSLSFDLPDRATVDLGPQGPLIIMHHTPTRPGHCRQHWLFSMALAEGEQTHALRWTDKEPEILRQDRVLMESAQLAYVSEGDDFERSVEADAPTLLARRIIRLAAAGRWPADKAKLSFRERLTIRS
jgi:phenylpropionate dioxygenase-like ring-hydroxylating dioxygenase large terminal subunit